MRHRLVLGAALVAGTLLTSACAGSSNSIPGTAGAFAPQSILAHASTDPIQNGCFSSGKLAPWKAVMGKKNGSVKVTSGGYGSCKFGAFAGTSKAPAPDGFYGVSQTVKVTKAGKLSWWWKGASNDEIKYGDQEVDVVIGGKIVDTCYKELKTSTKWLLGTCNLAKYAGKTVSIQFGVYDNGYSKTYDNWTVSDVQLQ